MLRELTPSRERPVMSGPIAGMLRVGDYFVPSPNGQGATK